MYILQPKISLKILDLLKLTGLRTISCKKKNFNLFLFVHRAVMAHTIEHEKNSPFSVANRTLICSYSFMLLFV